MFGEKTVVYCYVTVEKDWSIEASEGIVEWKLLASWKWKGFSETV